MDQAVHPQLPPPLATGRIRYASAWSARLVAEQERQWRQVRELGDGIRFHLSDRATYVHGEAMNFLSQLPAPSVHAIVTDPPYGLLEYDDIQLRKRRSGKGGVWRIPPSFDGARRAPLPRFTILSRDGLAQLHRFFHAFASGALRVLVPGGHVIIASNPLVSSICFHAFQEAGFEKRGELIRQVQTLRGGDRPKGSEDEFPDVSVLPRACWEPWGVFRKPLDGTVAENLRKWGTGGLRRKSRAEPLKDLIACPPARGPERSIAPHPSLKPQRFMRTVVRAALPLGIGIIYDPFAGSGSTLAAAEAIGYRAIGTDRSLEYVQMGRDSFDRLVRLEAWNDGG